MYVPSCTVRIYLHQYCSRKIVKYFEEIAVQLNQSDDKISIKNNRSSEICVVSRPVSYQMDFSFAQMLEFRKVDLSSAVAKQQHVLHLRHY